jgi:hypothetical protein
LEAKDNNLADEVSDEIGHIQGAMAIVDEDVSK